MHAKAIENASIRLDHARLAMAGMREARTVEQMELNWHAFLTAVHAVYAKLEQGAKANGKSEGWYGRKKHDRRQDPLLAFIHHARHSDQHAMEQAMSRVKVPFPSFETKEMIKYSPDTKQHTTEKVAFVHLNTMHRGLVLIPAYNAKIQKTFDVPKTHLGKTLEDISPPAVAELALAYVEGMMAEAASLAV